MRHIVFLVFLLSVLTAHGSEARQAGGFFRTEGMRIVDPQGRAVLQRGIGLGGWLMPEGYMLHFPGVGSWTQMKNQVRGLLGEADAERFWELYRENYVEEKDVAALAAAGFDHVRLPFHYDLVYDLANRRFRPEGFELLDRFVEWCRTYGLYVILDLHAAPGAQSDGAIADSDGQARLWTQPHLYQGVTATIWAEIAKHFADETQIVGYDLLNEPVTPESIPDGAAALRAFYELLVSAVRSVDTNHILFIEGNYWATTFDRLTPPFDSKLVYSFHKYWNATDVGTIGYLLAIRDTYRVPLWLGETGENSNTWAHDMIRLMDDHDLPWNWWTHKKIQSTTSPWSAPMQPGYRQVLDYLGGNGPRPTTDAARTALFAMAEGLDLDSTDFNPDLMAVLTDPDFGTRRRPWSDHVLPGPVEAVAYDGGLQGQTYSDSDYRAISGSPGGGNTGGRYRNDGVDIEASTLPGGSGFSVGWLEPGEWMEYSVWVETAGTYDVTFHVASPAGGGELRLSVDGTTVGTLPVAGTGGWQNWAPQNVRGIRLPEGAHVLRVTVGERSGYNLARMTFALVTPDDPEARPRPQVYPNPSSDSFSVRLPAGTEGEARFTLYDTLGRRAAESRRTVTAGSRRMAVDTSGLAPGLYPYRLEIAGTVYTGTVVVVGP